jgi:hypothetical protein
MFEVTFNLNQKQDGGKMGRDISFSSGEALFEFTDQITNLRNYYTIIENTDLKLKVVLSIEVDTNVYNCDLDTTAETDGLTYFKAKGIEDSALQIIKA